MTGALQGGVSVLLALTQERHAFLEAIPTDAYTKTKRDANRSYAQSFERTKLKWFIIGENFLTEESWFHRQSSRILPRCPDRMSPSVYAQRSKRYRNFRLLVAWAGGQIHLHDSFSKPHPPRTVNMDC